MDFSNPENIKLIKKLFNSDRDNSASDSDEETQQLPQKSKSVSEQNEYRNPYERLPPPAEPKTFQEWEERESLLTATALDDRQTPKYRIIYKQAVSSGDVYLGIGNRTSATSSCEGMCIEIDLPEETVTIDKMTLNVSANCVDLHTPIYHLHLPLVQTIDPDRGNASWDNEKKILKLILRMKREFDFINF